MVTPFFSSIREILINALSNATESIDIAVAWFTNEQLFDTLSSRLDSGVKVRMVLINDDINHSGGLDFQKFIDKGGKLFFGKTGYFMHNKYCIIDRKAVYTGSYNYTYFAEHSNFENIVCISDEEPAVSKYIKNYEYILKESDDATDIEAFLKVHPYVINTHATRRMLNRDLYQKANELYEQNNLVRAEEVIKRITPVEKMESFVIRDVLYKQWRPSYCIHQITVTDSSVELYVEVESNSPSIHLYGPGLDKTWHIKTSSSIVSASAITDVTFNESKLLERLDANTTYKFFAADTDPYDTAAADRGKTTDGRASIMYYCIKPQNAKSLSCRITFPKGNYINEIVDVYEGNSNDKNKINYFHFLRVNMLLNRETI